MVIAEQYSASHDRPRGQQAIEGIQTMQTLARVSVVTSYNVLNQLNVRLICGIACSGCINVLQLPGTLSLPVGSYQSRSPHSSAPQSSRASTSSLRLRWRCY